MLSNLSTQRESLRVQLFGIPAEVDLNANVLHITISHDSCLATSGDSIGIIFFCSNVVSLRYIGPRLSCETILESVEVRSSCFVLPLPTSSLIFTPWRWAEFEPGGGVRPSRTCPFGLRLLLLVGAGVPCCPVLCGEDEAREASNEYALCGEARCCGCV